RRIGLLPERLPAAKLQPARHFPRHEAEGNAGEIVENGVLALPVIGRAMPHMADTLRNGIKHFESGNHLARAEKLYGDPPARHGGDAVCEALRIDADTGRAIRPACRHTPLIGGIAASRCCEGRHGNRTSRHTQKFPALHLLCPRPGPVESVSASMSPDAPFRQWSEEERSGTGKDLHDDELVAAARNADSAPRHVGG